MADAPEEKKTGADAEHRRLTGGMVVPQNTNRVATSDATKEPSVEFFLHSITKFIRLISVRGFNKINSVPRRVDAQK